MNSLAVQSKEAPLASAITCGEVVRRLEARSDLSTVAKRDLKSAVTRVVEQMMRRSLESTPADPALLGAEMSGWNGVRFGLAGSTLITMRSQLRRALALVGVMPSDHAFGLGWEPLIATMYSVWGSSEEYRWTRIRLRALARWCERQKIRPNELDEDTIVTFSNGSDQMRVRPRAGERASAVRAAWEKARTEIPGWPVHNLLSSLGEPDLRRAKPSESQLPSSLIAELDAYVQAGGQPCLHPVGYKPEMSRVDRLRLKREQEQRNCVIEKPKENRERRLKRLSTTTLSNHRYAVLYCARALLDEGYREPEEIRTLSDVVNAEGLAAVVDKIVEDHDPSEPISGHAWQTCRVLMSVAKRCGIEHSQDEWQDMLEERENARDMAGTAPGTLTPKNRACLAQFDDPDNYAMLVALPDFEMEQLEAERRRNGIVTKDMAERAATAIATLIERRMPVRRRTLAVTRWKSIRKPDRRGGNATIQYSESDLKMQQPLDFVVPPDQWQMIELYWKFYRPVLRGADRSDFLFPGANGKHISLATLSSRVSRLVCDRLGLSMTLHNFRHVAADRLTKHDSQRGTAAAEAICGHGTISAATRVYFRANVFWAVEVLGQFTSDALDRGLQLLRRAHHLRAGEAHRA